MRKIFIINGGQHFAHSGGKFNKTVLEWDKTIFSNENGFEIKITDINEPYDLMEEVNKFVWADTIIYHTPVWWFGLPHKFKEYLDLVLTAGHRKGIYYSDGRKLETPEIGYGTGGSLHGRNYLLSTSWNAPSTAFTIAGEFFKETNVDDGVMFGFHRMNAFMGLHHLASFHFHDLEKNATPERIENYKNNYAKQLMDIFQFQTELKDSN